MLGMSAGEHREAALRLRSDPRPLPELQELADFHDLFAEMLIGVPGLRDE